jgi:glycosyltransferase involved in cell wall biosynthesis
MFDISTIPIVTISYNSPDLILNLLNSIRKFYSNRIYVIDGSDSDNAHKIKEISLAFDGVHFEGFEYNIHHGPGMAWAIQNLALSGPVLFIDSDMRATENGFIEDLYSNLQTHLYGVGYVIHINRDGFTITEGIDDSSVRYLHPALMLCNIEVMRQWPMHIKHGAPMTDTMVSLHDQGRSDLLLNIEWVGDVSDNLVENPRFLIHEMRGTVKRTGSYNLDEWLIGVVAKRNKDLTHKANVITPNSQEAKMNNHQSGILLDFFENHNHRMIHKWMHYFEIYERHFDKFRSKPLNLMEFGVLHGGSLQMWKYYFGKESTIFGIDINPRCADLVEDQIQIHIANQEDRDSLRSLCQSLPKMDIIIDDGGHTMQQQVITFEETWNQLKVGGIYLCEDLHTSYWPAFGGGFRLPHTFIEYSKQIIDQLHAWHSPDGQLTVDSMTQNTFAIHYYNSIVVIEKRAITPPIARMKGMPSFPLDPAEQIVFDRG